MCTFIYICWAKLTDASHQTDQYASTLLAIGQGAILSLG